MNKYPDAVHAILAIAQDNSLSTYARGKAFEDLACRLLEDLRGIEPPPMRNRLNKFGTEEIDLTIFQFEAPLAAYVNSRKSSSSNARIGVRQRGAPKCHTLQAVSVIEDVT